MLGQNIEDALEKGRFIATMGLLSLAFKNHPPGVNLILPPTIFNNKRLAFNAWSPAAGFVLPSVILTTMSLV